MQATHSSERRRKGALFLRQKMLSDARLHNSEDTPIMLVSNEGLFSIKSKQYVLIARAGLSLPSHEMDSKSIHAKMFIHHISRVCEEHLLPNIQTFG